MSRSYLHHQRPHNSIRNIFLPHFIYSIVSAHLTHRIITLSNTSRCFNKLNLLNWSCSHSSSSGLTLIPISYKADDRSLSHLIDSDLSSERKHGWSVSWLKHSLTKQCNWSLGSHLQPVFMSPYSNFLNKWDSRTCYTLSSKLVQKFIFTLFRVVA